MPPLNSPLIAGSIGQFCNRQLDVVDPRESVRAAAERMLQRAVGSLVACDHDRRPIGIVTDRDLTIRVLAHGKDAGATSVGEVMTRPVRTAPESTSVEDALSMMRSGTYRRLVVVDGAHRAVGILSLDDILIERAHESATIAQLLTRETPRVASQA
jgi:signal-transduction protein with cAMP-binding, CBS, and nucleotidyltransferase domain